MVGKTSWPPIGNAPPDFHEHALNLASESRALIAMNAKKLERLMPFIKSVSQYLEKARNQKSIDDVLAAIKDTDDKITLIKSFTDRIPSTMNTLSLKQWPALGPKPPTPSFVTRMPAKENRTLTVKMANFIDINLVRGISSADVVKKVNNSIEELKDGGKGRFIAAKQLKSGDVSLTARGEEDAVYLQKDDIWTRVLGRNAEIIILTYVVLVHGIKTNGNDPGDLKMAVKIENENAFNFSDACIKYTGWLMLMLSSNRDTMER